MFHLYHPACSSSSQAEISPPHARGLLSGMTQWMISWGFFIANWVGYGAGFLKSTGQFRVPLGIQIIPAVLLFASVFLQKGSICTAPLN